MSQPTTWVDSVAAWRWYHWTRRNRTIKTAARNVRVHCSRRLAAAGERWTNALVPPAGRFAIAGASSQATHSPRRQDHAQNATGLLEHNLRECRKRVRRHRNLQDEASGNIEGQLRKPRLQGRPDRRVITLTSMIESGMDQKRLPNATTRQAA